MYCVSVCMSTPEAINNCWHNLDLTSTYVTTLLLVIAMLLLPSDILLNEKWKIFILRFKEVDFVAIILS